MSRSPVCRNLVYPSGEPVELADVAGARLVLSDEAADTAEPPHAMSTAWRAALVMRA